MTSLLAGTTGQLNGELETSDLPILTRRGRPGFRARLTDHLAIAVGTTQGLFIVSVGMPDGPFFKGCVVSAFAQVGSDYLVATAVKGGRPRVWSSSDAGATWNGGDTASLELPEPAGPVTRVCQLQPNLSVPPATLGGHTPILAGVEPAALFRSIDGGLTFRLVRSLYDHPHRPSWYPGPDGLTLHTVLTHPKRPGRIVVGVSNGGVYRSDDGGISWEAKNSGIPVRKNDTLVLAAHGQQVYKLALDASSPDVLWAQTDTGVYRSRDGGDTWHRAGQTGGSSGVASDFGFPVVGHPVDPGTAFVFPLESGSYPFSPGGRCRVYRTTDGGAHWRPLSEGLPTQNAHVTVLGEAFTAGALTPYPLVFGTAAGDLFASVDGGESWRLVVSSLPPVLCVRVLD